MSEPIPTSSAATVDIDVDPNDPERISDRRHKPPVVIEPYNPLWPTHFATLESRIRTALGSKALAIYHIGSTSIPGLPAKDVIDVELLVADPTDEAAYVDALVGEGWEETGTGRGTFPAGEGGLDDSSGFQFLLREPKWYNHRVFICEDPVANIHVFSPGCPVSIRHHMFREWLIEHPEDLEKYKLAKYEAAAASREAGETASGYNVRKEPVILEILDRIFKAKGQVV